MPDGLRVIAVDNLDASLEALAALRGEGDIDALASCETVLAR